MSNEYKSLINKLNEDTERELFHLLEGLLAVSVRVLTHQVDLIPSELEADLANQVAKTMNSIEFIACRDRYGEKGGESDHHRH